MMSARLDSPIRRDACRAFGGALLAIGLFFGGCTARPPTESAEGAGLDLDAVRLVDLTYAYSEETLYWPTSTERFELTELAFGETEGGYFYASYAFSTPEHGGTHLDSPIHFARDGWTVAEIPLERLLARAVVIDVSAQAAGDRDYRLRPADVEAWEEEHDRIPDGAAVLLRTGWGQYWPDAKGYLGDDTPGDASNLHFPSYGEEAARFLVEERGAGLLGVDTASIDYGPSQDFAVHQIAGGANVPGLENVANLEQLPPVGAWLLALPIKIAGGSGGPVRIVAILP